MVYKYFTMTPTEIRPRDRAQNETCDCGLWPHSTPALSLGSYFIRAFVLHLGFSTVDVVALCVLRSCSLFLSLCVRKFVCFAHR